MSPAAISPATIYTPLPITVANPDFEQDTADPPGGWQLGGAGLDGVHVSISYDTTSQYEGTQSLVLNASADLGGISQNLGKVIPGEVYQITAALRAETTNTEAFARIAFLDANGNLLLGVIPVINYSPAAFISEAVVGTGFNLASAQGTVPFGAVSMQVQLFVHQVGGGTCEYDVIQVTRLSNAIPYYLGLLTSEYKSAPNLQQYLALLVQPIVDLGICEASMTQAFSLASAIGPQLDVLGQILGVSRQLPFTPTTQIVSVLIGSVGSGYTVGDVLTIVQGGASGGQIQYFTFHGVPAIVLVNGGANYTTASGLATTGGTGTGLTVSITTMSFSSELSDSDYRTLLQAKVLQNQWDGQADSLWDAWQILFPGGQIYITDNQNMTCTIFLVGNFSPLMKQIIINGLIVPRPEAVEYTFEFGALPLFGFSTSNTTFIAGFGVGLWS